MAIFDLAQEKAVENQLPATDLEGKFTHWGRMFAHDYLLRAMIVDEASRIEIHESIYTSAPPSEERVYIFTSIGAEKTGKNDQ